MATYKIGNKVQGIIRSYSAGSLGGVKMEYENQPYMIIKDIQASVSFSNDDKTTRITDRNVLAFNHDKITSVSLNNILITDRLLQLLYKENPDKLFSKQEYYESDEEGNIYFNFPTDAVYQVFIYNEDSELVYAAGTFAVSTLKLEANHTYSVYYSYLGGKSFYLNKPENVYITLDLEVIGNQDDNTQGMSIHIEKCVLKSNKTMNFNNSNSNTIDLTAIVVDTGLDYITLK